MLKSPIETYHKSAFGRTDRMLLGVVVVLYHPVILFILFDLRNEPLFLDPGFGDDDPCLA